MTRKEVMKLCQQVQGMPFCQLTVEGKAVTLTRRQYDQQMSRPDRPWRGPQDEEAWYDDEASEILQDTWYAAARRTRREVVRWEAYHMDRIPSRLKSF